MKSCSKTGTHEVKVQTPYYSYLSRTRVVRLTIDAYISVAWVDHMRKVHEHIRYFSHKISHQDSCDVACITEGSDMLMEW